MHGNGCSSSFRLRKKYKNKNQCTYNPTLYNPHMHIERNACSAHGYVYTATTSYNPNSRVDSERQSCSSGGRTDTESIGPGSSM